ncbi:MAG TPA: acetyl-CoA carboxylase biotin carboxyl carrier protein [Phycisphaerae bacterium]|nr:acetyl-CoA carboxylase biotin carboxyl carrier protein [Phycisphaerae bacterium]
MAKKAGNSTDTSFTDTKRVKDLIALMAENGLTEIELVEDKSRIVLRRGTTSGTNYPPSPATVPPPTAASHASHASLPPHHAAPTSSGGGTKEDDGLVAVKSPMVGTFYAAANPESDPFVSVGTEIQKDKTVVCIIEAMKVFNEIHADVSGTVAKVLVSNGQVVEFGQPLFMVKAN